MLDLKTLRALALATQEFNSGEWMACGPSFGAPKPAYLDEVVAMDGEDEDCRICAAPEWSEEHFAERSANMEFIAAANPAVILALIERLEAAEAAPLPAEQPSNPVAPQIGSISEHEDFREDLIRLSEPGLGRKQAKVIRNDIYRTIDERVRNAEKYAVARIVGQQTKGGGK